VHFLMLFMKIQNYIEICKMFYALQLWNTNLGGEELCKFLKYDNHYTKLHKLGGMRVH
jgi:hypothetical protein